MNYLGKNTRWLTVIRWLVGMSTLFYVFSRFIPATPPDYHALIDVSWSQALHLAFDRQLQFGRDIVFSYGPWGFLSRGYHPATHSVAVIAWTILSVVFWWAGSRVARHLSEKPLFSWLWLIGFTAAASLPEGDDIDARLTAWVVLLLFLHFFVEEGPLTSTQALLVVSLGWLSLVKFTGLMETMVVATIIAADNILRHRRFPWILPLLVASVMCYWIAAGQHLGSLGPYFCHSWQITGGYTEAMMLSGEDAVQTVDSFLSAAALLCVLIGYAAWLRHRFFGLLPLIGLVVIVFFSFKHGYVRDDWHEITGTMSLLLAAMGGLAIAWPVRDLYFRLGGLLQFTFILILASSTLGSWFTKEELPMQLARTIEIRRLLAPVTMLCKPKYLPKAYEENLARVRTEYPVPPIEGGVDIYSWNQSTLFAHGLHYQGRPVLQSYSAYTPELAELNAAWLRSDRAASNILFEIQPIDGRFPSLEDGRSWPELLTRYDFNGASDASESYLLLSRSKVPREYHLTPLQKTPARFGEPVTPPAAAEGPVWAEIEISHSFLGNVISMLYKPPLLLLTVSLRGGGQYVFRLIPGMARSGFLLSPVIVDSHSFAALASTNGLARLVDLEVLTMTISAVTQSGSTACYLSPMQIRFYRLDYPR